MVLQPVQHLFDVFLEQPECQPLVKFNLFGVPLLFQAPVLGQDIMNDRQDVGGALLVIRSAPFFAWLTFAAVVSLRFLRMEQFD